MTIVIKPHKCLKQFFILLNKIIIFFFNIISDKIKKNAYTYTTVRDKNLNFILFVVNNLKNIY